MIWNKKATWIEELTIHEMNQFDTKKKWKRYIPDLPYVEKEIEDDRLEMEEKDELEKKNNEAS
jgi:hypothetical protein